MKLTTLVLPALFIISCATPVALTSATTNEPIVGVKTFTQVNLHPDTRQKVLYNVNYQQSGLIAVCTEVEILSVNEKKASFKDLKSGEIYTYFYHNAGGESLERHLKKVFDVSCPQKAIDKLNALDKEGLLSGKPKKGMTKSGIIFAMGYPTFSATPSTESNRWKYWLNRFNTVELEFKDGQLIQIKD